MTPKDGNNVRNRYRRCMAARRAYGWSLSSFRDWLRSASPDSYSAEPHHANYSVPFLKELRRCPPHDWISSGAMTEETHCSKCGVQR